MGPGGGGDGGEGEGEGRGEGGPPRTTASSSRLSTCSTARGAPPAAQSAATTRMCARRLERICAEGGERRG